MDVSKVVEEDIVRDRCVLRLFCVDAGGVDDGIDDGVDLGQLARVGSVRLVGDVSKVGDVMSKAVDVLLVAVDLVPAVAGVVHGRIFPRGEAISRSIGLRKRSDRARQHGR